jgi:hypothetical protein
MSGQRADARFCSDACRVRAHRGTTERRRQNSAQSQPEGRIAVTNASRALSAPKGQNCAFVTDNMPVLPASKPGSSSAAAPIRQRKTANGIVSIVPDAKWPKMFRLRLPDGRLTDMMNIVRAKDALRKMGDGPLPEVSSPGLMPDASSPDSSPPGNIIHAELTGDDTAICGDITAKSFTPVIRLCQLLLDAGHEPSARLHVYRGSTLTLTVKSIGDGAQLVVKGTGFRRTLPVVSSPGLVPAVEDNPVPVTGAAL